MIGWILIIIAVAEFFLGFWFLTKYQKNQATFWYGLFSMGAAVYVMSNGFGFLGLGDPNYTEKVGWSAGAFLTACFLGFSYSFPLPRKTMSELLPLVIWPIIVFVPAILFTTLIIGFSDNQLFNYKTGYMTASGPYFWTFMLFFGAYWTWSIRNLIINYVKSDGIHRWQMGNILFGVATSLVVSITFDIIFPLVVLTKFGYIGSLATSVWLGFTSYIIVKK